MRRILVDYARRRLSGKRGAGVQIRSVDCDLASAPDYFLQWVEIDNLLDELEKANPRVATTFKLHYFVGLTFEQAAEALGVHPRTARRDYDWARAWLYTALQNNKQQRER